MRSCQRQPCTTQQTHEMCSNYLPNSRTNVRFENWLMRGFNIVHRSPFEELKLPLQPQLHIMHISMQIEVYFYLIWFDFFSLPDSMPAAEPNMAWKQTVGEESSRARRMRPAVQGLSQPYTWPTPTGTDRNSCQWKASFIYILYS